MSEKTPQFWRDPQLPFVEARAIADGRQVCYSLHSHEFFSIGAITGGVSTYVNGERRMQVSAGDLVVINPQQAHACNPIADRRWSYIMFYLDLAWLGALQQELLGGDGDRFVPFSQPLSRDPALFHGLNRLYALLTDPLCCALENRSPWWSISAPCSAGWAMPASRRHRRIPDWKRRRRLSTRTVPGR